MTEREMLDDKALDILFREARTHSAWKDKDVPDPLLRRLFDLLKWGPTSANGLPMRVIFVKSEGARARLKPHLSPGNVEKTMYAPVTAIIGHDLKFHEHLPKLFPHADARRWFAGNDALITATAFRNGSLQGAYLILAARALGLDCGPMSGFSAAGMKKEFFPDNDVEVNFLCNLGYGDPAGLHSREPRFNFDDVCTII